MEVCVVGAGVIGLSSAVAIQDRVPSARMTIVADKFGQNTTSYGSGGLIVPVAKGIPEEVGRLWCQDSINHFFDLAFSPDAKDTGVSLISGYELTNQEEPGEVLKYCLNVNKLDQSFLQRIASNYKQKYKYGFTTTTCLVDLPVYMKWLTSRFLAKGGKMMKRRVKSLHELSGQYDVLVNCTGFSSQQLVKDPLMRPTRGQTIHVHAPWLTGQYDIVVNCTGFDSQELDKDPLMRPMRGQTIHVHAPWVKSYFHTDDHIHIFPFSNSVYLGSIKQLDRTDMAVVDEDGQDILARTQSVFPALKGARVLWQWVGIRPQRDSVRLEEETILTQGKPLKVIHNYGHGSFGISLSWGCAMHVTRLVDRLDKQRTTSKL